MRSLIIYILISLYICPTFCRADTPLSGIEWQAFWIKQKNEVEIPDSLLFGDQSAPIFRKEFRVKPGIREATLHITGLGYYEAYLNHEKIGDLQLDPAWTHYSKRIYYSTFNVTAALQKKEEHCLGVMAGNGWYNPLPMPMWGRINLREHLPVGDPCFIAQLHLEYENGDREIILSDDQWKVSESDVRRNNVYLGEVIDRRLDPGRWASYGYNDSNWQYAVIDLSPKGELLPQPQPPIRITEQIRPAGVFKKRPRQLYSRYGDKLCRKHPHTASGRKRRQYNSHLRGTTLSGWLTQFYDQHCRTDKR
ncbi:MAG: alpha-L-rhamnosidase N-terminal domain-containing protein [Tannerellaceae bacterium]|nr:alpha-L-rhamnosidase N-terminal domain-containing protein [Tannerellaceae bacterium]